MQRSFWCDGECFASASIDMSRQQSCMYVGAGPNQRHDQLATLRTVPWQIGKNMQQRARHTAFVDHGRSSGAPSFTQQQRKSYNIGAANRRHCRARPCIISWECLRFMHGVDVAACAFDRGAPRFPCHPLLPLIQFRDTAATTFNPHLGRAGLAEA